jgi:hypothetical protein
MSIDATNLSVRVFDDGVSQQKLLSSWKWSSFS